MPNSTILATAEGMPKFHRQQIMASAWPIYRRETRMSRPTYGKGRKKLFAQCLRAAWAKAKHVVAEAVKTVSQRAADRVQELTLELMRIDARPWGIRTYRAANGRAAIQAEMNKLREVISQ